MLDIFWLVRFRKGKETEIEAMDTGPLQIFVVTSALLFHLVPKQL